MVAIERADNPCFLQRGQSAAGVQLAHLNGRLDDIDRRNDGAKVAKPEPARGAKALEAIEDLDPAVSLERAHGGELTVLLERRAHRGQRARVGEPKGGEPLAEIGDGHEALGMGGGHDAEPTTTGSSRSMPVRDAVHVDDRSRAIFPSVQRAS